MFKRFILPTFLALVVFSASLYVLATTGTLDPARHYAKLVHNGERINSGVYTTPAVATYANVTVSDTELHGYMFSESFGWIKLNCADNGSCGTNGNFKVSVDSSTCEAPAKLSGFAFSDAGWVNFGPFLNTSTPQVTIDTNGRWNGYAWSPLGWIEWQWSATCAIDNPLGYSNTKCTSTDWRPPACPTTTTTGSGSTGTPLIDLCNNIDGLQLSVPFGMIRDSFGVCSYPTTTTSTTGSPTTTTSTTGSPTTTSTTTGSPTTSTTTTTGLTTTSTTGSPSTTSTTGTYTTTTGTSTSGVTTGTNTTGTSTGTTGYDWCPQPGTQSSPADCPEVQPPATTTGPTTGGPTGTTTGTTPPPNPPGGPIIPPGLGIAGLIVGAFTLLTNTLAVNPFSLKDLALLPFRAWTGFWWIIGIRRKPWGVVYDSKTKRPLDPAYVTLYNDQHQEVENTFTDMEGRYGFKVKKGTYYIIAKKTHYLFPSRLLEGKTKDDVYDALYFGGPIIIEQDGQLITENIPMDKVEEDWNEAEKERRGKTRRMIEYILGKLLNAFYWFGFAITAFNAFKSPTGWNLFLLGLYVILFILSELGLPPKTAMGSVIEKITENPIPSALVRVYSAVTGVEITRKVTDENGRYYALVKDGMYHVTVQKQQQDGSHGPVVHQTLPIKVKKGVLSEKIEL